ncbi:transient receptor potential cation channel subfamily A member 1-like [Porites lutea]|uniref:transient receptor potential cation channel subfamily A member 1-like n=1 Tax=Porites lutea TaxID=51062 RepID=UPI003CC61ED3
MDKDKKVSFDVFPEPHAGDEELLVVVNQGASDSSRVRRRSRAVSKVSMGSEAEEETEDQSIARTESSKSDKTDRLHQLILAGNEEEAVRIINKGNEINRQDKSGKTPLHTAILSKQYHIVDKLLESGADVTINDDAGDTPLHTAIHVGSDKLVLALLHRGGCDVGSLGRNSATPLHLAAEMDNDAICKILVENNASLSPLDGEQMTPVGRAVERGASKSARYLLKIAEEKMDSSEGLMYNVDLDGGTLLHLAANSGVLAVVELCVEHGVRIRQPRRSDKMTAFHMACEQGSMPIVEYLVSKDPAICRITLLDHRGKTPLHLAAGKNHTHIVEFLLEKGAALDPKDDDRRTPLYFAASYGASSVVKLLMEREADVTIRDTSLKSIIHAAVGDSKSMEYLLESPAASTLITEKDEDGFSAVHYAAKRGDIKNIRLFVTKNRTSSSVLSNNLDTPIHVAARYGWTDCVEALMENQHVKIINLLNSQGKTALHFACAAGHNSTAEVLLRLGAVIERDQSERTPLHLAATKGSLACCKLMVNKYEECVNDVDKSKNTAMNLAAINGHPAVVEFFLSNPAAEVLKNSSGENVLDIASKSEQREVAAVIAKHERWIEVLRSCSTPLVPLMTKMIEKMPEVAVLFLDQCMEEKGDPESQNYMVKYDLNLVQGQYPGEKLIPDKASLQLIETMALNRRERCLTHPISFVLLNTKWKKFGWLTFALNLFSYFCFIVPLTVLAVDGRHRIQSLCKPGVHIGDELDCTLTDVTTQLLSFIVLVATIVLLAKHLFSLFRKRMAYLLNIVNFAEWVCYIAAIVFVVPSCDCKTGYKLEVGAIAVFFGWLNLILYFRRLSSYGQYVIMLTTMFVTLVKVLLLWMLFIMAFGTTFYMIMEKEPFDKFGTSLMTMYVMTLGELNYDDNFTPWEKLNFATLANTLFVVLVLGMPIIMMNMLVGLAVGDIDKIQQNALMDRYVLQVQLLLDIERSMPMWILKRVQVQGYSEYPNHPKTLKTKLADLFISFGKPETEIVEEEEELSPGMVQVIERLEQQEKRVDKMYDLLREQTDMLKELNQLCRAKEEKQKEEKKESEFKLPGMQMFSSLPQLPKF